MNQGKLLLIIDAIINLFLGIVLLLYSKPIVSLFGLPETSMKFYPTILGSVLFGIGVALIIEYKRKNYFIGLGVGGAISINLIGGFVLLIWLLFGNLEIPVKGKIILWTLDIVLIAISILELMTFKKTNNE